MVLSATGKWMGTSEERDRAELTMDGFGGNARRGVELREGGMLQCVFTYVGTSKVDVVRLEPSRTFPQTS